MQVIFDTMPPQTCSAVDADSAAEISTYMLWLRRFSTSVKNSMVGRYDVSSSEEVLVTSPRASRMRKTRSVILGTAERRSKLERTDRGRRDTFCGTKIVRGMAPWL
jgi:hypothetical protein